MLMIKGDKNASAHIYKAAVKYTRYNLWKKCDGNKN